MVRDDEEVDGADAVGGADEVVLFVAGEVAEVEEAEASEGDFDSEGAGVFCCVCGGCGRGGAEGVGEAGRSGGPGNEIAIGDEVAVGAEDSGIHAFDRQDVAGFGDQMVGVGIGDDFLIGGVEGGDFVGFFAVFAVVDEGANGDLLDELSDSADVVVVEVGDEDVVDAGEAEFFRGSSDAVGVAGFVAWPAGVDEERLAERGDEEGGLAAFYVDEGGAERFGLGGGEGGEG